MWDAYRICHKRFGRTQDLYLSWRWFIVCHRIIASNRRLTIFFWSALVSFLSHRKNIKEKKEKKKNRLSSQSWIKQVCSALCVEIMNSIKQGCLASDSITCRHHSHRPYLFYYFFQQSEGTHPSTPGCWRIWSRLCKSCSLQWSTSKN